MSENDKGAEADRLGDRLAAMFAAMATDGRVSGGCDSCAAYQTLRRDPEFPSINHVTVHHDDGCPVLARMTGRPS